MAVPLKSDYHGQQFVELKDIMNNEKYQPVKDFFDNQVLVFDKWQYYTACIKNGIDTLEKLKAVDKKKLIELGLAPAVAKEMVKVTKEIEIGTVEGDGESI